MASSMTGDIFAAADRASRPLPDDQAGHGSLHDHHTPVESVNVLAVLEGADLP